MAAGEAVAVAAVGAGLIAAPIAGIIIGEKVAGPKHRGTGAIIGFLAGAFVGAPLVAFAIGATAIAASTPDESLPPPSP